MIQARRFYIIMSILFAVISNCNAQSYSDERMDTVNLNPNHNSEQPVLRDVTAPVGKIEDDFSVTPMGQANYEIPILTLPGTGGIAPKLTIAYNSSTKSGLLGYGFDLRGLSIISRVPENKFNDDRSGYVNFTSSDKFAMDGMRLILVSPSSNYRIYRTEQDTYSRITAYGDPVNPSYFIVETKDGLTYEYHPNTKIINSSSTEPALFWMLTKVTDTKGNYFTVSYTGNNEYNEIYPSRIDYTGNDAVSLSPYASVRFCYEDTPDTAYTFVYGHIVRRRQCINAIESYYGESLQKKYEMTYTLVNSKKELTQVKEIASDGTSLNPTTFQWYNVDNLSTSQTNYVQDNTVYKAILTPGDYNGDGLTDFVSTPENANAGWSGIKLYTNDNSGFLGPDSFSPIQNGEILQTVSGDFNGDGMDDIVVLMKYGGSYHSDLYLGSNSGLVFSRRVLSDTRRYSIHTVETNGDGAADLFAWFENTKQYKIVRSYSTSSSIMPLAQTTSSQCTVNWDRVEFVDFNGDGLTDVVNYTDTSSYVMYSDGAGTLQAAIQNNSFCKKHDMYFGDFNGDGKTDILVTRWNNMDWSQWQLHKSNGANSFRVDFLNCYFQTSDKEIFVADVNGDGFDDFYAIDKTTPQGYMIQPLVYLNDGTGTSFAVHQGSNMYGLDKWRYYFSDFNGDGKTDILSTSAWHSPNDYRGYQLYTLPKSNNLLLSSITDGLGNTTSITYKYMSDDSVHVVGNRRNYPLTSFSSSWPVVYQVKTPDGIGGTNAMTYKYEDALMHRRGRGVLGFMKVIAKDETKDMTTKTCYTVGSTKYVLAPYYIEKRIGNRIVSESITEYTTLSSAGMVFSFLPISREENTYDFESGLQLTELHDTIQYDGYGNVTRIVSTNGDVTTTTENTYTNDETNWILGRLTESTVTKANATETQVRHASFEYDQTSGLLTKEYTEPDSLLLGFSKTYIHDAFGNIVKSITTPNDTRFASRTDSTNYDNKGRFILSTTNSLGHTTTNSVDMAKGLLMSTTDPNGIVTSYTYDSFGRQTQVSTPLGSVNTSMQWDSSAPHSLYSVHTEATGEPAITEYYDCLGRAVRKEQESISNQTIIIDTEYNKKGQTTAVSSPYFSGSSVYKSASVYDAYGRLRTYTAPDQSVTQYAYNGFTTTITDPLGHTATKTVDVNGNLVESIDNEGNSVTYEYDVSGHCKQVNGPSTTISMEYDLMGNRKLLNDPDLGTVQSVYNAFGELVSQTDSKGTTVYTYDNIGRLVTEQRSDVTINTTYDIGYIGLPSSMTASNSTSKTFAYDQYGRPVGVTETINGRSFTTATTYNSINKADIITYPSGFKVRNGYTSNGIHNLVSSLSGDTVYWQLSQLDPWGQVKREQLGNGLQTITAYNENNGRVSSITTGNIQNWNYAFDANGNLTRRTNMRNNLVEEFDYDGLSRLTTVYKNNVVTQRITYDNAGNITSKTGVGHDFVYQTGTNRLVSFYADSPMPKLWDNIQYTSFHKIRYVSQDGKYLTLTYGPDMSRVKSVTTADGVTETKYYVGGLYEESTKGGVTRQTCYISAGGRTVAIRETSSTDGTRVLYVHRDHLGTIQAYSDESGNLVQELSYDAWGRRRNPTTWEYYDNVADANAENPWGFGGHEHLDIFEMVNMDGRMYDPILGRFLSPDPFVQAPDFTQSLNRYTYCLNNPLSLTDPTGYSWFSDNWKSIVASVVGITVSALTMGITSGVTAAIIAGAAGGAAGALTGALLNGANIGQIAKQTFLGAFWGAASGFLNFASADDQLLAKIFKHTFSQGWLEGIQGGDMFHGFMMGAVSGTGSHFIHIYAKPLGDVAEIAANAVLSGTVSELGGGKFANGAITGAYSIMFNDMMHSISFKRINWKLVTKKLKELYSKYKNKNPELYKEMGGQIKTEVYDKYRDRASNACALKLSIALEYAGFFIPEGPNTLKASNGRNYYVSAGFFFDFLADSYAENTHYFSSYSALKSQMNSGIFYQHGNWKNPTITGHIDAMYNGVEGGIIYNNQPLNVGFY